MTGIRPVQRQPAPGGHPVVIADGRASPAADGQPVPRPPAARLIAQRGLFAAPLPELPADLYLKIERGVAERERHELLVAPHAAVSTNTYFGRFPASYWQRWTTAGEVEVELECSGSALLSLVASDSTGDTRVVASQRVRGAQDVPVRLGSAIDRFVDGGSLWLEAETGDEPLTIRRLRWTVARPESLRPSTVVVCTHNRVEDCLNTLAAMAADAEPLAMVNTLYVVDQGSDPVESRPRFAEIADSLHGTLCYLRQPNLGGSGGFTRGLFEANAPGAEPSNVVFMDDDVRCEPEVVLRLSAFANWLAEPAIVGGQMLNLLHPTQLLADAEHADLAKMLPGQVAGATNLNRDLIVGVVPGPGPAPRRGLADRRLDASYNGWWCCLLPPEIVEAIGYPMPFFFQWDDIEYGYRAREHGYATVTLPGAGLWHADFHWKDWDEWHRYFNMRNGLITAALHHSFEPRRVAGVLASDLAHYVLGMQYGLAATLLKAVEDFLAGPSMLDDGGVAAMAEIRALRAKYPETMKHQASQLPGLRSGAVSEIPAGPPPSLEGLVLLKRIVYQLLGRGPHHVGTVSAGDARWWHVSLFDTAVVTDMSQEGVRVRRRDRDEALRLTRQGLRLYRRFLARAAGLQREYREALPRLSGRDNWQRLYGRQD